MLFRIRKQQNEVEKLVGGIIDDFVSGKSKRINDVDDMVEYFKNIIT